EIHQSLQLLFLLLQEGEAIGIVQRLDQNVTEAKADALLRQFWIALEVFGGNMDLYDLDTAFRSIIGWEADTCLVRSPWRHLSMGTHTGRAPDQPACQDG